MRTIEQMVQQEINCCLSSLISTLANGDSQAGSDLAELCDRALGLAMPVPDYEEAARQAGWSLSHLATERSYRFFHDDGTMAMAIPHDWQALCVEHDIEPYDSVVYEHWAVSQWLAEKLVAHGEKVDTDFADLNVWARQNTGQEITADGVIMRIYKAMMEA
jgi:hypothetical protein